MILKERLVVEDEPRTRRRRTRRTRPRVTSVCCPSSPTSSSAARASWSAPEPAGRQRECSAGTVSEATAARAGTCAREGPAAPDRRSVHRRPGRHRGDRLEELPELIGEDAAASSSNSATPSWSDASSCARSSGISRSVSTASSATGRTPRRPAAAARRAHRHLPPGRSVRHPIRRRPPSSGGHWPTTTRSAPPRSSAGSRASVPRSSRRCSATRPPHATGGRS